MQRDLSGFHASCSSPHLPISPSPHLPTPYSLFPIPYSPPTRPP
ncbi:MULTISPECIES: hypothetical protein [Moorena]|nr:MULTISPECIES: hypothetical protein [Moorena]